MTPWGYKTIHNLAPADPSGFVSHTSLLLNDLKTHQLIMISHAPHLTPTNCCYATDFILSISQMRKLKLMGIGWSGQGHTVEGQDLISVCLSLKSS